MSNKSGELAQGNNGDASLPSPNPQPQPGPQDHRRSHSSHGNPIFKSGPLFLSSKGIGWTSWKKRWFILTQNSLVFFRSDPSVVSEKGDEVNLTLGGIDLNNSGSVVVKADKKLLTVQFPDFRDGRAFTLKAETLKDLYEWKLALENALAQAPSAANVVGQNGIFRGDQTDSHNTSLDQLKDRDAVKYKVIGRPILHALEEVDGTPSFLEKALRFIEEHGVKVEGILRQAADVEHVENRVREYETGKVEFSEEEDAHVIADCVKHVLRQLPSSPVPASCCKALLEARRTERGSRVSAMRAAICDTFPEPNRHLLQRILLMMQSVASCKAENRMSSSAVAACMAPLLLRPLLAGDCEIENDFDVGGDGSLQLLQAAAAANHAQAIVITLLEEYDSIFGVGLIISFTFLLQEGSVSPGPDMYFDSEDSGSESEEATDDDLSYDDYYDDEEDDSIQESDVDADDDVVSQTDSETGDSTANDEYDDKDHDLSNSRSEFSVVSEDHSEVEQMLSTTSLKVSLPRHEDIKSCENVTSPNKTAWENESNKPADIVGGFPTGQTTMHKSNCPNPSSCLNKSITISNVPAPRRRIVLGRTSARKNLSMESIDFLDDDEPEIERLETVKTELQNQIAEEVKVKLQSDMETRKKALQERRLVLEQDVARLQEQLLEERRSRATLETKADLEELVLIEVDLANLERKVGELGSRLNVQLERNYGSLLDLCNQTQQMSNHERNLENKPDAEVAATSESDRSISQDTHFGVAVNDNERMPESPLPNKHPPSSKKSGTRGEGANSTTSALTKLTSRLFSKDRRNQISDEPQNMDKGQELSQSSQNLEKGKGSESRGFECYLPLLSPNWSRVSENHSPTYPENSRGLGSPSYRLRKSDSQPGHHLNRQNQYSQAYLKRGMSEGHRHQSYNVDKGRLF
ncbi:rho GTPase-activating protein REN1-like [Gastrolobium bilobum]|uniref:rho GTPase-activating protein REN1-like n=1 Tax=Gastrolobium bilobum TaxID=150636 RepID=UPI002AB309B4|nr:rho GTPase-activating protein REN1-like [Gastrolobium bilobum]